MTLPSYAHFIARLVVIELKRGYNPDTQYAAQQLYGYVRALSDARGLRPEFAASYKAVCRNLADLGVDAPRADAIVPGMPVVGLLAEEGLPLESELLMRARNQADELGFQSGFLLASQARDSTPPSPGSLVASLP